MHETMVAAHEDERISGLDALIVWATDDPYAKASKVRFASSEVIVQVA